MDFGANITPVEVIREGSFGYSDVTGELYKK